MCIALKRTASIGSRVQLHQVTPLSWGMTLANLVLTLLTGYALCHQLTGTQFQSVFNKELWAANAKLISYYMIYGCVLYIALKVGQSHTSSQRNVLGINSLPWSGKVAFLLPGSVLTHSALQTTVQYEPTEHSC